MSNTRTYDIADIERVTSTAEHLHRFLTSTSNVTGVIVTVLGDSGDYRVATLFYDEETSTMKADFGHYGESVE